MAQLRNCLSFKDFVEKYGLKNEATSNVKIKEILKLMNITECGIYMRDDKFTTTSGIVNLHPTKGTHWVMFTNQNSFDSYGCPPPTNILNHIKNGIYSEYQISDKRQFLRGVLFIHTVSHKYNWVQKCSTKFILPNFQT